MFGIREQLIGVVQLLLKVTDLLIQLHFNLILGFFHFQQPFFRGLVGCSG